MRSRGQGGLGRREFLRRTGAVVAAAGLGRLPRLRAARLDAVGIPLYTLRGGLAKDVEGAPARPAGGRFPGVEVAGFPEGPAQTLTGDPAPPPLRAPSGH